MAEPEPDLARLRPLFILEKLSPRLRSDVLADGSIVSVCGFTAKRPAHLIDDIVVIRDELFVAFRNASNVPVTCQLHDTNDALIDATISINEDGSGTVNIAAKRMRLPWVTLLSSDVDKRLWQLDRFLDRYPLSDADAASLRALVARQEYSDDDFLAAATMLESSPEAFTERLSDKLRRQGQENRIAPVDVLPDDDRYWNHLLPPVDGSVTLAGYIAKELQATWHAGIDTDPVRALHALATTFAAPELVPRDLFQGLNADTAAAAIESVSKVEDPFSLAGAFEICADRSQEQRFAVLGERLLENLFGDMQRLTGACALFGAIFVITTAHFATHETLQRRPVYWRRLAAAAHASLVVRVCGGSGIDPDQMISWATRLFGEPYFLSVVSDFAVEPQWRPEWICRRFWSRTCSAARFALVSVFRRIPLRQAGRSALRRSTRGFVRKISAPLRNIHPFSRGHAALIARRLPNFKRVFPKPPTRFAIWQMIRRSTICCRFRRLSKRSVFRMRPRAMPKRLLRPSERRRPMLTTKALSSRYRFWLTLPFSWTTAVSLIAFPKYALRGLAERRTQDQYSRLCAGSSNVPPS